MEHLYLIVRLLRLPQIGRDCRRGLGVISPGHFHLSEGENRSFRRCLRRGREELWNTGMNNELGALFYLPGWHQG